MKRLLLLSLLLVGCAPAARADLVTSWGTQFVFDDAKTRAIHQELRDCMQRAIDTEYYGLDRTRREIQSCQEKYWTAVHIGENPPTFYSVTRKSEKDPDPFEEFGVCAYQLASPMWDFPPEATTYGFRDSIRDCLAQYPA